MELSGVRDIYSFFYNNNNEGISRLKVANSVSRY